MISGDPNTVAISVCAAFILVGPIIGLFTARRRRKNRESEDPSLRFGPVVTGLSAAAAGNSAFILIGAVGLGYVMGLSALWMPLAYWVGDIIFWYFIARRLVHRFQTEGVNTISELIASQTLDRSALPLRIAAVVTILAMGIFCMAQFLAVGKIASEFLDLSFEVAIAAAVVVCLLSVLLGGLGASMLVNVYQSILMLVCAALLVVFTGGALLDKVAAFTRSQSNGRLLDPLYGFSAPSLIALILAFMLSGLLFATCNPPVLERITKGEVASIPRLRWIYMGFTQGVWWLMILTGVGLAALGTQASDPDSAAVIFAETNMPAFALGVFFAGVAAASMSTAEAQLLVIANTVAMDIAPQFFQQLQPTAKRIVLIAARIFAATALYVALVCANLDTVANLVYQSGAILFAAFAVPAALFIYGMRVPGLTMALIILAGAGVTLLTSIMTSLPPAQELLPGLAAAGIILAAGKFTQHVRSERQIGL